MTSLRILIAAQSRSLILRHLSLYALDKAFVCHCSIRIPHASFCRSEAPDRNIFRIRIVVLSSYNIPVSTILCYFFISFIFSTLKTAIPYLGYSPGPMFKILHNLNKFPNHYGVVIKTVSCNVT